MQILKSLKHRYFKRFFIALAFLFLLKATSLLLLFLKRRAAISASKSKSEQHAQRKREERRKALSSLKLPAKNKEAEQALLNKSILQIQSDFEIGAYRSYDLVVEAIRRTIQVGVKENYVSDQNFQNALRMAQECDRERELGDSELGVLHGIPISIKDQIYLKGTASNWCHSHNSHLAVEEDATLVKILMKAGAIPFVKSTTPLTSSLHTESYLWGEAKHPRDSKRIIGGSSGGEAGLISKQCSILGVGTDTAGSLRIPASFCGLKTIYPTTKRMPSGKTGGDMGPDCKVAASLIKSTPGPMGRTVDDLECFLRVAMSKEAYSIAKFNAPIQYSLDISHSKQKLRIGYFTDSDILKISPASKRAIAIAKEILQSRGHQVVDFDVGSLKQGFLGLVKLFTLDQGKMAAQNLTIEPGSAKAIQNSLFFARLPKIAIKIISQLFQWKQDSLGDFILPEIKGEQYIKLLIHRREFSQAFIEIMKGRDKGEWLQPPVDALLCPAMPYPPPYISEYEEAYNVTAAYIGFFNYVGFPAGVIPVTKVQEEEAKWDPVKDGEMAENSVTRQIRKAMQNCTDLPVSVQIASLPYHEEVIIRLMRQIEEAL